MKKTIFTLNIGNYAPELTAITYPLMKIYAHKIGADFFEITERKFPDWPVTYEKLQIYELAKQMSNDWNFFFDADAMIHPCMPDWTIYMKKDTIAHWGSDVSSVRHRFNEYMLRDGRGWGSANWFTIASDWCLDLWRPLDITPEEAIDYINPTHEEMNFGLRSEHFVDDFALTNNVSRFGLKTIKLQDVRDDIPAFKGMGFVVHGFMMSNDIKRQKMEEAIKIWNIAGFVYGFDKKL
jgi:hypothetical protein